MRPNPISFARRSGLKEGCQTEEKRGFEGKTWTDLDRLGASNSSWHRVEVPKHAHPAPRPRNRQLCHSLTPLALQKRKRMTGPTGTDLDELASELELEVDGTSFQ